MTNTRPTKTSFQRKYNKDQVLDLLENGCRQISDEMVCHKRTAESLIKILLESSTIGRINISESKPLWVYSWAGNGN